MDREDSKAKGLRTKEAAEERIRCQDYVGARTLITEAQTTFPGLENVSKMLIVCEVLCSADIELPGCGVDWYWVLQLFPSDGAAAVEACYRSVISQLESIKNDFLGTELALKLVEDAFSVLSDPEKRAAFDLKRNSIGDFSEDSNSQIDCIALVVNPDNEVNVDIPSSSRLKRPAREACARSRCSVPLAENCIGEEQKKKICAQEARLAIGQMTSEGRDDLVGLEKHSSLPQSLARQRPMPDFHSFKNNAMPKLFSAGQVWVAYDQENTPRRYALIEEIVSYEKLCVTWFKPRPQSLLEKRWCDVALPVVCGSFDLESNRSVLSDPTTFSHLYCEGITKQPFGIYPQKGEVWAIYRDWNIEWCSNPVMRKRSGFAIIEILADCTKFSGTKVVYLVKADGFRFVFRRYLRRGNELSFQIPSDKLLMFSHNIPAYRFIGGEINGISNGMLELDPLALPGNLIQDFSHPIVAVVDSAPRLSQEMNCNDEASVTHLSNPSLSTRDTARSNIKIQNDRQKWSTKDFVAEQVWAVYDGQDAMPRSYVRVTDVVSPNKVHVTFLDPHPTLDEEFQWIEERLPFACGIFRAGRRTVLDMNRFSHIVRCEWSSRKTFYRIFPRKGEVWAMYRNWSSSWRIADIIGYQCQIVEILSDFSESTGISVGSLTEVEGCLTFFHRQLCGEFLLTRKVSRLEMLSFSHRIPAFTVCGIRDCNIPNGSWHLEPDALPPKFISEEEPEGKAEFQGLD